MNFEFEINATEEALVSALADILKITKAADRFSQTQSTALRKGVQGSGSVSGKDSASLRTPSNSSIASLTNDVNLGEGKCF